MAEGHPIEEVRSICASRHKCIVDCGNKYDKCELIDSCLTWPGGSASDMEIIEWYNRVANEFNRNNTKDKNA